MAVEETFLVEKHPSLITSYHRNHLPRHGSPTDGMRPSSSAASLIGPPIIGRAPSPTNRMTPRFPPSKKVVDSMYRLPKPAVYTPDSATKSTSFGPGFGSAFKSRFPDVKTTTQFCSPSRVHFVPIDAYKHRRAPGWGFGSPPSSRPVSRSGGAGRESLRPLTPTTLPRTSSATATRMLHSSGGERRREMQQQQQLGRSKSSLLAPPKQPSFATPPIKQPTRGSSIAGTPGSKGWEAPTFASSIGWPSPSAAPSATPTTAMAMAMAPALAEKEGVEDEKELVALGLADH